MIAEPATVTATNHAYKMKRVVETGCHPINLEGVQKAAEELTQLVGNAVSSNARKVQVKTVGCPQGFFYRMEAWR